MTSKIKNAVTKAIHNLFGDDYAVYYGIHRTRIFRALLYR